MKLNDQTKSDLTTIEKVMLMVYNNPHVMIKEVFGDCHPTYFDEQQSSMINNFGRWWSRLDAGHRARVVETSDKHYATESKARIERY